MILLLIAVFAGIALIEIPGLVRNGHWRELAAFSFFYLLAFAVGLLQTIGVEMPRVVRSIQYVMRDILNLHY